MLPPQSVDENLSAGHTVHAEHVVSTVELHAADSNFPNGQVAHAEH